MLTAPDRTALPAIADEPEEELATALIEQLMRRATANLHHTDNRIVLRGGTAAKIGFGLTRPSNDMDIDLLGDLDPWRTLQDAAEQTGLVALAEPARRRTLKGQLKLTDRHAGTVHVEIDIRRTRSTREELEGATHERRGVLMYRAPMLFAQELEMLDLPASRVRAKDRYDLAWWLNQHIDQIDKPQRVALARRLAERPDLIAAWNENQQRDGVMKRADANTVQTIMRGELDLDPAVLEDHLPNGDVDIWVYSGGGSMVQWNCNNDAKDTIRLASFENDRDLETFMRRVKLWTEKEIPERLKELSIERTNIEIARPTR